MKLGHVRAGIHHIYIYELEAVGYIKRKDCRTMRGGLLCLYAQRTKIEIKRIALFFSLCKKMFSRNIKIKVIFSILLVF